MNIDRSKLPTYKREELKRKVGFWFVKNISLFQKVPFENLLKFLLQEDAELTKQVYQEFVADFQEPGAASKTFVRGEVVNPDTKNESTFFDCLRLVYGCKIAAPR